MIPLYGFLEGDSIGLLVLAEESDTAAELAEKLQTAARVRVRPVAKVKVVYQGVIMDPQTHGGAGADGRARSIRRHPRRSRDELRQGNDAR